MKFSVEKNVIIDNIANLINIVPSKNTMPILTHYLIEANEETGKIKITATDLEITIVAEFEAKIFEGGKAAVAARYFTESINSLPNSTVTISSDDINFKITCKKSKFNLFCADYDQFPLIPTVSFENAIEIDALIFAKMVRNTAFSVAVDFARPVFTGVFWKLNPEMQIMVSTDGRRVSEFKLFSKVNIEEPIEKIVPPKGLLFLEKAIGDTESIIKVRLDENRVIFSYGNFVVFTHVIEGRYPNYEQVIPKDNTNILLINKSLFRNSIRRVAPFAAEESLKILFDLDESRLIIDSMNREIGDADDVLEDFKYSGRPIKIALNHKWLTSILTVIESDDVEIRFGKPKTPVVLYNTERYEDHEVCFVLMPLRLK